MRFFVDSAGPFPAPPSMLPAGEGETTLREYIQDEIASQGQDPRRELATIRDRMAEIDQKASVLLEGMSPEARAFIDTKLRDLGNERRRLQNRLEELEAAPYEPIDAEVVLRGGKASPRCATCRVSWSQEAWKSGESSCGRSWAA